MCVCACVCVLNLHCIAQVITLVTTRMLRPVLSLLYNLLWVDNIIEQYKINVNLELLSHTFRALIVSMNLYSSSGGRKSTMKCFPRFISVSFSAHSVETHNSHVHKDPITTNGLEVGNGDCLLLSLCRNP